jgi:ubiquitin-conjugating enzyme E2 variant
MPILGPRFLRPFRLHHSNPDDILERGFVDLNGDVALLATPLLAGSLALPLAEEGPRLVSAFLTALATFSLPTNQIHQWAHQAEPPVFVRWLQGHGLILGREHHRQHHTAPYASHYCITTGWCNALLGRLRWFRRLERAIQRSTGLVPRDDDAAFANSELV